MTRTPFETLVRLAELAPKEWGFELLESTQGDYADISEIDGGIYPDNDDIENGQFTAWCKAKIVERGCQIASSTYTFDQVDDWGVRTYTKDNSQQLAHIVCPTEWQAVAEALIQVLEREKE
jgi:hypothetical protein